MLILGIDSSTDQLAVGLADAGRVIADKTLASSREHAARIIGLIDEALTGSSLTKQDLTGVAVAIGPGSFTGLRVGLAVAKGMALALKIPVVGISTFEVIARRLSAEHHPFYLAAQARKGEYYLGRVDPQSDIASTIIVAEEQMAAKLIGSAPVGFIGLAAPPAWAEKRSLIDSGRLYLSGGEMAFHGAQKLQDGKSDDPATLEPLYIVPSQAENKSAL